MRASGRYMNEDDDLERKMGDLLVNTSSVVYPFPASSLFLSPTYLVRGEASMTSSNRERRGEKGKLVR